MEKGDGLQIFRDYKKTGDISLRNEIVLKYVELVRHVAISLRNIYAKYADLDDIVNEGVISLIAAVDSFDPERGFKFETYANIKIKGAIIDFVRKQDWVPRSLRAFGKELDSAYSVLYNELSRSPTNEELAAKLGLADDKFEKKMVEMAGTITLSFEELLYEDNFDKLDENNNATDHSIYEKELKEVIASAINSLTAKGKQVITLYYYERLKFSEIAKVLCITQSRVCQIHSKSMLHLKRELENYINGN